MRASGCLPSTRAVRVGGVRLQPRFDVYNLFNANTIVRISPNCGTSWLLPQDVLAARLFKFGVQLDF